jgi:hypothetical protein
MHSCLPALHYALKGLSSTGLPGMTARLFFQEIWNVWSLEPGAWSLEPGVRSLEPGARSLGSGQKTPPEWLGGGGRKEKEFIGCAAY